MLGTAVLILADVTDQIAGLDGYGLIEDHDAVRLGFSGAFQRIEMNVLVHPLQFSECPFTANRHFGPMWQLRNNGTAGTRLGANTE